jgi:hypothetical protein
MSAVHEGRGGADDSRWEIGPICDGPVEEPPPKSCSLRGREHEELSEQPEFIAPSRLRKAENLAPFLGHERAVWIGREQVSDAAIGTGEPTRLTPRARRSPFSDSAKTAAHVRTSPLRI